MIATLDSGFTATKADLSHGELTQAKRDFKTLQKAHAILHDPERKRNAHLLADAKNESIKRGMLKVDA